MSRITVAAVVCLLFTTARAQELKTDDEKTLYSIGVAISKSLDVFNLTPAEFDVVKRGLTDGVTGKKTLVELDQNTQQKINQFAQARMAQAAEKNKAASKAFLDKAAKEKGAQKTASGLIYTSVKEGSGPSPKDTDTVKVNYKGTFIDGKEFDSSAKHGKPAEFAVNQVIPCWTEGLQKMKVGGKAKLVCPSSIAYGDRGNAAIPAGSTLVFDVELLEIVKPPAPASAPASAPTSPPQSAPGKK